MEWRECRGWNAYGMVHSRAWYRMGGGAPHTAFFFKKLRVAAGVDQRCHHRKALILPALRTTHKHKYTHCTAAQQRCSVRNHTPPRCASRSRRATSTSALELRVRVPMSAFRQSFFGAKTGRVAFQVRGTRLTLH